MRLKKGYSPERHAYRQAGSRKGFTLIELPVVRKRAFTLIELLVVIAIIAILATIVIINVAGARTKAQDAKVMDDVATIARAAEVAKAVGILPDVGAGALKPGIAMLTVDQALAGTGVEGTAYPDSLGKLKGSDGNSIVGSNPTHPISGQSYYFHSIGANGGYYVVSGQLAPKNGYLDTFRVQVAGHSGVNRNGTPIEDSGGKGTGIDWCSQNPQNSTSTMSEPTNSYVLGKDIHALAGSGGVGGDGGSPIVDCSVAESPQAIGE